jgi:hypothetical protein
VGKFFIVFNSRVFILNLRCNHMRHRAGEVHRKRSERVLASVKNVNMNGGAKNSVVKLEFVI